ncbi:ATP-binding protein [Malaciobacter marinus]|uniref:ATP-binding protein n=1 Tax=Malaciobacter marinus TaxID=505249 RepID=UPI003B003536
MKFNFNSFLIFTLLCICFVESHAKNNILIISSYTKGNTLSDKITNPILKNLNKNNIHSNIIYLNSLRKNKKKYEELIKKLFLIELDTINYDILVAIDDAAYEFLKRNYKKPKENQKIVFVGNKISNPENTFFDKTYGIIKDVDILGNVSLIQKFFPDIKKIHIINNNLTSTQNSNYKIFNINNKEIKVIFQLYDNLNSLKYRFNKFKKDEAVLFIKLQKDENNELLLFNHIKKILNSFKIPIFITDTIYSGQSPIGGKLIDIGSIGEQISSLLIKILNNKKIEEKITFNKDYIYIFDYEKVKEFNVNPLILHKPFTYVNSYLSIFEKDNILINFVFIISPFLLIVIFLLLYILFFKIKNKKIIEQRLKVDKVLLDAIKTPVVWQNDKGEIINSNSEFSEFLELTFLKKTTLKEFLKNNNFNLLLEKLRTYNKYKNNPDEIALISDNTYKIYFINETEYYEGIFNTKGKFTVFADITKERLTLEEKIKNQEFMIQQSKLAEIGEIFSSIAHQWKTPLLEITTIAQEQIYSTDKKIIDEENNAFVNDIMVQVRYMGETISDFQNFIMPSTRKVTFNISEAVTKMLEIINHNIKYNYIKTNVQVQEDANLNILGYKNELMQILLNIVNNAKDSIVKRRKEKRIKEGIINIDIKNIQNDVLIQIEDNGGGIPKEHINNIFKPYYTTKENGHGIGLYMAKLIIEDKMDGTIEVENTNNGAMFSIKLKTIY